MNLYLIGSRCTGKTSVGKYLAGVFNHPFIDADVEISRELETTISDFVRVNGWDAFREKEREVMARLTALENHIIATGGGVVLDESNVNNMKKSGVLVWLKASPEVIQKRMLKDEATFDNRPSLSDKGVVAEIEEILFQREPLYKHAANIRIETDGKTIEEIGNSIIKELNNFRHFRHFSAL